MLAADYIFPPSTNFKFRIYEITVLDLEEKAKSICGDIEFLKNSRLAQIAKENARNFSKCDYCEKIRTDPGSNSTENDAAFAYLMGNKTLNILNWVRTLRSSSCRCSIIFIVTQQIYETHHKSVWGDLQNCGVTIHIVPYNNMAFFSDIRMCRKVIEYVFAAFLAPYFDRIMFSDVFDTIFQKDPFQRDVPRDKVALSIERVTYQHQIWERIFMQETFSYDFGQKLFNYNKFVINSGFTLGKPELIERFYYLMVTSGRFFQPKVLDQTFFNYIIYTKQFTQIWVDFNATYYASACYSVYELEPRADSYMYDWDTKTAPAVIHQMDRICPLTNHIYKTCPAHNKYYNSEYRKSYEHQRCNALFNPNDRSYLDSRNATIDF